MTEGKVLPYLDIPFQHASPEILKAMKRPAAQDKTLARIKTVARGMPGADAALDLHRRLSRRDRFRFCLSARLARGSRDRSRRLLQVRAGRGRFVECARRCRARGDQAGALECADGAAAEDFRAPAEAQGRHPAAGHHRRSRPDRLEGPLQGRRAARSTARSISRAAVRCESARSSPRRSSARTNTTCTAASPDSSFSARVFLRTGSLRGKPCAPLTAPAVRLYGPRHDPEPDQPPRQLSVVARSTMMGRAVSDDNAEQLDQQRFREGRTLKSAAFLRFGLPFHLNHRGVST